MWSAAQRLQRRQELGQNIVLLHLGDHDPSGRDMSRDIQDRLDLFGTYDVEFHRIALNMDQIDLYNPPPNPTKITDSRSGSYIKEFGHICWELDALEPGVISDLIKSYVVQYRDESAYQKTLQLEADEYAHLEELSDYYPSIQANWEEIKRNFVFGGGDDE